MDDKLNIKCPGCGSILQIKNLPNIQDKTVTCPTCKLKSRIRDCERIALQRDDEEATQYGFKQKEGSEDTVLGTTPIAGIGRLVNMHNKEIHQLRLGRNTIGRRVSHPLSTVTLAIAETQTNKTMSREHAIIEVTRLQNGSYRHFLCNWKGQNGTWVDGMPISADERMVLNHGQTIKMGQVLLRFEIV